MHNASVLCLKLLSAYNMRRASDILAPVAQQGGGMVDAVALTETGSTSEPYSNYMAGKVILIECLLQSAPRIST